MGRHSQTPRRRVRAGVARVRRSARWAPLRRPAFLLPAALLAVVIAVSVALFENIAPTWFAIVLGIVSMAGVPALALAAEPYVADVWRRLRDRKSG